MSISKALGCWFKDAVAEPLGAGHIHNTYLVSVPGGSERFVAQKINEDVFNDVNVLMRQSEQVVALWKRQQRFQVPTLRLSNSGKTFERVDGSAWRVWGYLEEMQVVDPVENARQVESVASAFSFFQEQMKDLPAVGWQDTIAGFLQLGFYLERFDGVAHEAPADLRALIDDNRSLAERFAGRNAFIHGDCKVNNVLFDSRSGQVGAVIDFDTVMHGHWAWDFGDLVRSVCFSSGGYRADLFEACVKGFLEGQQARDPDDLVLAPCYVALMLGVRFLTDHLQGDVYFRVKAHGENLRRAGEQFRLCEEFLREQTGMSEIAEV